MEEPADVELQGTVEDLIFQNDKNGYTVFSLAVSEETEVVCVGTMGPLHPGESLLVRGTWTVHPTYGRQLTIQYYEKTVPTTEEGIRKYLASGLIKGIGKKTAEKIVDRFGEATFYVIEEKPERLVEIRGITYEKAMRISEAFCSQHEMRRAMVFLQQFGISPAYALRIYQKYKSRTFDILQTNPYRLADDISGIGFLMADKIAAHAGIAAQSPFRVEAGVKYILNRGALDGHTYLPQSQVVEQVSRLLSVEDLLVENAITSLQLEHQIWREKQAEETKVYLNLYYYAEIASAKKILELLADTVDDGGTDWDKIIAQTEIHEGIHLAEKQRQAVKEAMTNGLLIITGGPGTGKTTTIRTMLEIFQQREEKVLLAAPTGRAAKRMNEATGLPAQTIHRLLGTSFLAEDSRSQRFEKNEEDPLDADVIVVDEMSMVDILLWNSFLKAVSPGTRLVLVGDVDQLPSVGPGNVLKDLIRSGVAPVVSLNEIFRQAKESAIITNAHLINEGKAPVLNDKTKDFFFVHRSRTEDAAEEVIRLIQKRLPAFTGCESTEIQVLSPMRKGTLGVTELNRRLQQALNPPGRGKKEKAFRAMVFREGDKVMQIKNNYNLSWKIIGPLGKTVEDGLGVFNGDTGVIERIDLTSETMEVLFDDNRRVSYDFTQLEELELSYATTIHKSQGSEYPVVIIPLVSGPPMLLTRNLLYTAVTRARILVVLVGVEETMRAMVDNNREVRRYSSLDERLRSLDAFMRQGE